MLTVSTSLLNLNGRRSSLYESSQFFFKHTILSSTNLFLANKRAPKHTNTLADHADIKLVFILEPVNDLLKRGITAEGKAVPECPFYVTILVLLGGDGLRESEEWESKVDETVLVGLELLLAVNDLREING